MIDNDKADALFARFFPEQRMRELNAERFNKRAIIFYLFSVLLLLGVSFLCKQNFPSLGYKPVFIGIGILSIVLPVYGSYRYQKMLERD